MASGRKVVKLSRNLLYEQFADSVRQLIREDSLWGKYLPSERELARVYGVSHVTVRRGLELLAGEGLIVRKHGQGTRVLGKPRGRTHRGAARVAVASFFSRSKDGYLGEITTGLTWEAGNAGWSVSFFGHLGDSGCRSAFLGALRRGEIDGLILLGVTNRSLVEEVLRLRNGPTVLVDHHFPDLPLTSVMDDSRDGARQTVEHLLELGHRRIGYIDAPRRDINPWRFEGYAEALRSAGIEPDDGLIAHAPGKFEDGLQAAREFLARPDPPTAVMGFCDNRAWGAWRAAEEKGLEVGRNFAVAGYGNAVPGSPEALTSVAMDMQRVGEGASRELTDQMAGRSERGRLVLEPVRLVVRDSSREARVGMGRK